MAPQCFDLSPGGPNVLSDAGGVRGLHGGKKAAVLSTAGGGYGGGDMFEGLDCLTPNIQAIFNVLGLTDLTLIAARPYQLAGPHAVAQAVAARRDVTRSAQNWMPERRACDGCEEMGRARLR